MSPITMSASRSQILVSVSVLSEKELGPLGKMGVSRSVTSLQSEGFLRNNGKAVTESGAPRYQSKDSVTNKRHGQP